MNKRVTKFFKLLRIEMEDLEEDVRMVELRQDDLYSRGEITSYVFKENLSILEHEIRGLHAVFDELDELNDGRYEKLSDAIIMLEEYYKKRAKAAAWPEALHDLVKRKIEKVVRFMTEDEMDHTHCE